MTKPDFFYLPNWDSLGKNVKLRQRLNLPKAEFEIDKVKYEATDLRLLNNHALNVFGMILCRIRADANIKCVQFNVTDLEENDVFAVGEIITGLDFKATKGGRNGYTIESHLFGITGCSLFTNDNNERILEFHLDNGDHVNAVHNYLNSNKEPFEHTEIIRICAKSTLDEFKKFVKEKKQ